MIIFSALCLSALAAASEPSAWFAGVARRDITPSESLWLAGYASRDKGAEGQYHPIWVKALALRNAEGKTGVIVTSDILGFPKPLADQILKRAGERTGLASADIILSSSHTHSGPVLEGCIPSIYPFEEKNLTEPVAKYTSWLGDQVVDAIDEAVKNLAPATLSAGTGVVRFAVNRRNNKEAELVETTSLNGPADHSVPTLCIKGADGSLKAVLMGYACHATVLCEYKWGGDYPGFAQIALEEAYPGATAMFFAGCGADCNPLPRRSVALANQYGRELAAAVERVLEDPMRSLSSEFTTARAEIPLELKTPATRAELEAEAAKRTGWELRVVQHFLKQLDAGQELAKSYPYPVQVWNLGGQSVVALGGEVVVDYAISAKAILGRDTFVMGYANDVMAYIPSLRVLREGGYEGGKAQWLYGLPADWADNVEESILNAIREQSKLAGFQPK